MQALLAGVNPTDAPHFRRRHRPYPRLPPTALTGSLVPALRAIHIDPATAIRVE